VSFSFSSLASRPAKPERNSNFLPKEYSLSYSRNRQYESIVVPNTTIHKLHHHGGAVQFAPPTAWYLWIHPIGHG